MQCAFFLNKSISLQRLSIPVYRGDAVNSSKTDILSRTPDPKRLLLAATYSRISANYIQKLCEFQDKIQLSHEALLLDYEKASTKKCVNSNKLYNIGAHLLWLGARTQNISHGHVQYLKTIENPIGIKISKNSNTDDIVNLISHINPDNKEGRICLITRIGSMYVNDYLPKIITAIKEAALKVTWICDPMHGNTIKTKNCGIKTRYMEEITREIEQTILIHSQLGTIFAGLHLETTPEDVYECSDSLNEDETKLQNKYESLCDPRLNSQQTYRICEKMLSSLQYRTRQELTDLRKNIDDIDRLIIKTIADRLKVVAKIGQIKKEVGINSILDTERESQIRFKVEQQSEEVGLDKNFSWELIKSIINSGYDLQK